MPKKKATVNITFLVKLKKTAYCYRNIPFVTLRVCRRRQSYLENCHKITLGVASRLGRILWSGV
jgi:hypothetical protein